MEKLVSFKKNEHTDSEYVNALTRMLDKYMEFSSQFVNYIYDSPINNTYPIRFPGATRGGILVDNNNIILDIILDKDHNFCYKENIFEVLKDFKGKQLVFMDETMYINSETHDKDMETLNLLSEDIDHQLQNNNGCVNPLSMNNYIKSQKDMLAKFDKALGLED